MAARLGDGKAGGALVLVMIAVAACGRPTGDFGRAEPSFLHDKLLPAAGNLVAEHGRKEPVSRFPLTDDEIELRNRAWAFVRAPHVRDWWLDTLVEGERTRILPILKGGSAPSAEIVAMFPEIALPLLAPAYDRSRYHRYLLSDGRISTETLWTRVIDDARADTMLIPPFCDVAARVRRADVERLGALRRQRIVEAGLHDGAEARVWENEETIAWVWQALGYRAASYRYAIDHFQVEAPSGQLFAANRAYDTLIASKCIGAPAIRTVMPGGPGRHSRLMEARDPFDEPVLQK
ncbi:hypothetical protein CXZ10_12525 [Pleomorphomonas diazotrophica]|uniref:Uncharacterized protein n=1 Tax=Pleomorphomonas diazotrophica TaxID=1166257 RepID=A0A1I4SGF5_9HYPH|nr:hypothetical protein [Pleomorphomonas diazotrophica]PKR88935.1 hypothetical protein CXZ10_12525 [Pleomorphomonas diazotrophica]SFM63401.1 hypothetical protein SAMN05192571_103319 [Pleomorphomonas diazotrophica]